jgi:inositol-phosphate phosphatase/L-galactose 1-phosphate phosphatase/histidinol-phosphatase
MHMTQWNERLATAVTITEAAAKVAMSHFRTGIAVETKPDESPVTVADKATEQEIREGLAHHFSTDAIFGEEFGGIASDECWIIDPIDGTRSFIVGLPLFGMLLGYLSGGKPALGVIRMPALDEVYAGSVGGGATCNGVPISVSTCTTLPDARLFINEGDKLAVSEPDVFAKLIHAGALRRLGADCYPHALVAAGYADAVVDFDLQPYDFLPVSAVVTAAGGMMTDWSGEPLTMASDGRTLTAATPELHSALFKLVSPS